MGLTNWFRIISSVFLVRSRGLLRLREAHENTHFDCLKEECKSNCCWVFDLVQIESDESKLLENKYFKAGDKRYLKKASYECEVGVACSLLEGGICTKYDSRPKSCSEYPWYKFDGTLYYDSACPGIQVSKIKGDSRPELNSLLESTRYFNDIPKWIWDRIFWYITNY